jgi:hypothetical protein
MLIAVDTEAQKDPVERLNSGTVNWVKADCYSESITDPVGKIYYVYRIVNTKNGKSYIGFATDPNRRWSDHLKTSANPSSPNHNDPFKCAIRKHGRYSFTFEILFATDDRDKAFAVEVESIERFKTFVKLPGSFGYNSTPGGEGHFGPELSVEFVLERAREYIDKNGKKPNRTSGDVEGGFPGDCWSAYDTALNLGYRGFRPGSSLAKFLAEHLGTRNHKELPDLTEDQIVDLMKAHKERTGSYPIHSSGYVTGGHPGDSWCGYNLALSRGTRGLPGGSSLAILRKSRLGVRNHKDLPKLNEDTIVELAKGFREKNGTLPNKNSGPASGEDTWGRIDTALREGLRGLPGGSSLAQLIRKLKQT